MPAMIRLPPSSRSRAIDTLRRPVCGSLATITPAVMYGAASRSNQVGTGKSAGKSTARSTTTSWTGAASMSTGGFRPGQSFPATVVEILLGDAERQREAGARVENIADHGHGAVADVLEEQSGASVAQGQYGAEFEARIDAPGHAMQLPARVESGDHAAQALFRHPSYSGPSRSPPGRGPPLTAPTDSSATLA